MSTTLLAILAIVTILIIMVLIFKEICPPFVAFLMASVVVALVLGYKNPQLQTWFVDGAKGQAKTIALVIFCISFFFIQNEVGAFDGIVNFIIKKIGGKPLLIMIAGWLVATLSTLDGQSASTILVTVPAMLPIYKKAKIRPIFLCFQIASVMGCMGIVPWSQVNLLNATQVGVDGYATFASHGLIWVLFLGWAIAFGLMLLYGTFEVKRINAGKNDYLVGDTDAGPGARTDAVTERQKKMRPFNFLLIIALIVCLFTGWVADVVASAVALVLVLLINYDGKTMRKAFSKCAPMCLGSISIILAVGIWMQVFRGTNMMSSLVSSLLAMLPESLVKYAHIIFALIKTPVDFFLCNTMAMSLVPVVGEMVVTAGACSMETAHALMTCTAACGMVCCASDAYQFVLLDMAGGVSLKDHAKYALPRMTLQGIIQTLIMVVLGFAFL